MAVQLRRGGEFIHSGDAIGLSVVFSDDGPAFHLANDLAVKRTPIEGVLADSISDDACCAIQRDDRRYHAPHSLWYITLAGDMPRRVLHYGDKVTLRLAGTEQYLSVKPELNKVYARDLTLGLSGTKDDKRDVYRRFIISSPVPYFTSRDAISSGSSLYFLSVAVANHYITARPPPTLPQNIPPICHFDTGAITLPALDTDNLLIRRRRLVEIAKKYRAKKSDVDRQAIEAEAASLNIDLETLIPEYNGRTFPGSSMRQSPSPEFTPLPMDSEISQPQGDDQLGTVQSYLSPHAYVGVSRSRTPWTVTLRGSSSVPASVLRGGDIISFGLYVNQPSSLNEVQVMKKGVMTTEGGVVGGSVGEGINGNVQLISQQNSSANQAVKEKGIDGELTSSRNEPIYAVIAATERDYTAKIDLSQRKRRLSTIQTMVHKWSQSLLSRVNQEHKDEPLIGSNKRVASVEIKGVKYDYSGNSNSSSSSTTSSSSFRSRNFSGNNTDDRHNNGSLPTTSTVDSNGRRRSLSRPRGPQLIDFVKPIRDLKLNSSLLDYKSQGIDMARLLRCQLRYDKACSFLPHCPLPYLGHHEDYIIDGLNSSSNSSGNNNSGNGYGTTAITSLSSLDNDIKRLHHALRNIECPILDIEAASLLLLDTFHETGQIPHEISSTLFIKSWLQWTNRFVRRILNNRVFDEAPVTSNPSDDEFDDYVTTPIAVFFAFAFLEPTIHAINRVWMTSQLPRKLLDGGYNSFTPSTRPEPASTSRSSVTTSNSPRQSSSHQLSGYNDPRSKYYDEDDTSLSGHDDNSNHSSTKSNNFEDSESSASDNDFDQATRTDFEPRSRTNSMRTRETPLENPLISALRTIDKWVRKDDQPIIDEVFLQLCHAGSVANLQWTHDQQRMITPSMGPSHEGGLAFTIDLKHLTNDHFIDLDVLAECTPVAYTYDDAALLSIKLTQITLTFDHQDCITTRSLIQSAHRQFILGHCADISNRLQCLGITLSPSTLISSDNCLLHSAHSDPQAPPPPPTTLLPPNTFTPQTLTSQSTTSTRLPPTNGRRRGSLGLGTSSTVFPNTTTPHSSLLSTQGPRFSKFNHSLNSSPLSGPSRPPNSSSLYGTAPFSLSGAGIGSPLITPMPPPPQTQQYPQQLQQLQQYHHDGPSNPDLHFLDLLTSYKNEKVGTEVPPTFVPAYLPGAHSNCPNCYMTRNHVDDPVTMVKTVKSLTSSPLDTPTSELTPENKPIQPSALWIVELVNPYQEGVSGRYVTDFNASSPSEAHPNGDSCEYVGGYTPTPAKASLPFSNEPITPTTAVRLRNIVTGDYLAVRTDSTNPSISTAADAGGLYCVPPWLASDMPLSQRLSKVMVRDQYMAGIIPNQRGITEGEGIDTEQVRKNHLLSKYNPLTTNASTRTSIITSQIGTSSISNQNFTSQTSSSGISRPAIPPTPTIPSSRWRPSLYPNTSNPTSHGTGLNMIHSINPSKGGPLHSTSAGSDPTLPLVSPLDEIKQVVSECFTQSTTFQTPYYYSTIFTIDSATLETQGDLKVDLKSRCDSELVEIRGGAKRRKELRKLLKGAKKGSKKRGRGVKKGDVDDSPEVLKYGDSDDDDDDSDDDDEGDGNDGEAELKIDDHKDDEVEEEASDESDSNDQGRWRNRERDQDTRAAIFKELEHRVLNMSRATLRLKRPVPGSGLYHLSGDGGSGLAGDGAISHSLGDQMSIGRGGTLVVKRVSY